MQGRKSYTIPKEKIVGQRLGQLIYNAIRDTTLMKDSEVGGVMHEMENEELQKAINKFIEKQFM